ncbi:MAG: ATP-binding protein [Victivallaceae bacterium]|jgi:signal transduction histidine kinase
MLESLYAVLLTFLEMTFIFVGLALLHNQRKVIGSAAFYVAIGLLFVFTQFVSASELSVNVFSANLNFSVGSTVLFLPYLGALMLVYATQGTLEAQRMITGAIAGFGLFIYLSTLTSLQCNWLGFAISQGTSADSLDYLLQQTRRSMTASTIAQLFDLFLLPIFFQRLRNANCRVFFCVLGAMLFTQLIDSFIYLSVTYWDRPQWWLYINNSFLIKSIATVWVSALISIYLFLVEKEVANEPRGTLDIIFAFLGGYGKAQILERNLREWEGRYRMVVENASEMIMLLDQQGCIIDANYAAIGMLKAKKKQEIIGANFMAMLRAENQLPLPPMLPQEPKNMQDTSTRINTNHFKCYLGADKNQLRLDISISAIEFKDVKMHVLLGRDITEESRLASEKEILSEQLAHSQRLEAVGQLAGGVAHDFNNHIHAILGHLDLIRLFYKFDDPKVSKHLDKITDISEQAGRLTGQLLGFARKGKYQETILDLSELIRKSTELFMPNSQKSLDLIVDVAPGEMPIRGDKVQLQQVIINLLINARDAMDGNDDKDMRLVVKVDSAEKFNIPLKPVGVKVKVHPEDYYCIMIEDNGCGMDKSTMLRIFEPFFTTKPIGKGTGMGLAMVYGTVSNHHGWVQVNSKVGRGTAFYVLLPKTVRRVDLSETATLEL